MLTPWSEIVFSSDALIEVRGGTAWPHLIRLSEFAGLLYEQL